MKILIECSIEIKNIFYMVELTFIRASLKAEVLMIPTRTILDYFEY